MSSRLIILFLLCLSHMAMASLSSDVQVIRSDADGLRFLLEPEFNGIVENEQGRFLRVTHSQDLPRPIRRLHLALPGNVSPRILLHASTTRSLSGPVDAGFKGGNPVGLVEWRVQIWDDLRILELDFELLRENSGSIQLIDRVDLEVSFEGAATSGFASRISDRERGLLLNGDQAANWAFETQTLFRDGEPAWDGVYWIQIPVSEEGLYRIQPADLSSLGLDPSLLDPAAFKLYGFGGRMIPENPQDPGLRQHPAEIPMIRELDLVAGFSGGDRLLFYGKGLSGIASASTGDVEAHGHDYADVNQYLLLVGGTSPGLEMADIPALQGDETLIENPRWRMARDEANVSAEHSTRGWFMKDLLIEGDTWTGSFPAPLSGTVDFRLELDMYPYLNMPTTWLTAKVNGQVLDEPFHPHTSVVEQSLQLSGSELEIEIQLQTWAGKSVYLDYAMPSFETPARYVDGEVRFESYSELGSYEIRIQDPPVSHYLMDITHFDSLRVTRSDRVRAHITAASDHDSGYPRLFYGVEESRIRGIDGPRLIDWPFLMTEAGSADMIVVAPEEFLEAAQELVDIKNNHGTISARLVSLDDIYLRHNAGVADPGALRNFLRREFQESQTPAGFVLFAGNGHFDYRGKIAGAFPMRMPTWYRYSASTSDSDPMIDDFFVRLESPYHLDMAYGRLPANSVEDVRAYNRKLESYLSAEERGLWRNKLLFVADDEYGEDHGVSSFEYTHSQDSEVLASQLTPGTFQVERLYLFDYPSVYNPEIRVYEKPQAEQRFVQLVNEGVALVNFMGHGNNTTWTHENVFTSTRHLPLIENAGRPTFFIAATCSWAEIDLTIGLAMPQQLVNMDDGGAIGIVAATRKTGGTSNDNFVRTLLPIYLSGSASGSSHVPLGEALRLAKNDNYDSNRQKYIYLGDPSLQPPFPEFEGELTELSSGGQAADSLLSGALAHFAAHTGDTLDAEHGLTGVSHVELRQPPVARIHFYDPYSANVTPQHLDYEQPGGLLFSGPVSMIDGRTGGSFYLPSELPIQDDPARLRVYMVGDSPSGHVHDALVYHEVMLAQNPLPTLDEVPPVLRIYLNGPQWREDDLVAPNSILYVEVQDSSGVNVSGELGKRIEVEIDGNLPLDLTASFEYDLDDYQGGRAAMNLPLLEPGLHQLNARAFDNAGNPGYAEAEFNLIDQQNLRLVDLLNSPNPVDSETRFTFMLEGLQSDAIHELQLSVYTVRGRRVTEERLELNGEGGFFWSETWRPRNDRGEDLARGLYFYKLKVHVPETVYSLSDENGSLQINRVAAGSVEGQGKLIVD